MVPREFFTIAAGNLWRMKLRTGLTVAGVVIGVGALVAMLSFAFGMQKNVSAQFQSLDLLHTLHVLPPSTGGASDSTAAAADSLPTAIDDEVLARIAALDGVAFVYPQDTFDAQLKWRDQEVTITAQALPTRFARERRFGELIAGRFFASDSAAEAVVSRRLLNKLEADADSLIGDTLTLKVVGRGELAREAMNHFLVDYGVSPRMRERIGRIAQVLLRLRGASRCTLVVSGVADLESGFGYRLYELLVPSRTAARLDRLSFRDPVQLLALLSAPGGTGYPLAVVTVEEGADQHAVSDEIEAMGLRTFSFIERFEDVLRAFLIFDLIVGIIGFIALVVAALGIINTMVMSILERTREIGILKSLGAQDGHIRWLFLVESCMIGLIGSLGGLALGWVISRIASFVAKRIMASQETPIVELFYIPPLAALGAILFGIVVSLLAGLYPAARAVKVDPVHALRHE